MEVTLPGLQHGQMKSESWGEIDRMVCKGKRFMEGSSADVKTSTNRECGRTIESLLLYMSISS